MKKIILANIGNRNLTYQGQPLLPDTRSPELRLSFRERTLELLHQYDTVKTELNEQILSVLLRDVVPENIEKVVLFASDNQIEGDRNDQDTIHEAQILQRLFAEQMNLTTEIVAYTQNVTHNDELLQFYRNQLRPYQSSNAEVIICDAGGTAQQKAALKIAAEYLLDPSRFTVRYVLPSGKITTVEQVEYRRIIDEEQVAALVEHGQYAGALAIYLALPTKEDEIERLIRFADLRVKGLWSDALQQLSKELKKRLPSLKVFGSNIPSGNYDRFAEFFKKQDFFLVCERFELAQNNLRRADYSSAVLNFQIFQETFLSAFISSFGEYNLADSNYVSSCNRLIKDLTEEQSSILNFFGGSLKIGVPLLIKYAQQLAPTDSDVLPVLGWFERTNAVLNGTRKGTDDLRNNIAHKGKGVDEALLKRTVPAFELMLPDIQNRLGIPPANSFFAIEQLIINILRR